MTGRQRCDGIGGVADDHHGSPKSGLSVETKRRKISLVVEEREIDTTDENGTHVPGPRESKTFRMFPARPKLAAEEAGNEKA